MTFSIFIRPLTPADGDAAAALRREAIANAPTAFLTCVDDDLDDDELKLRAALELGDEPLVLGAFAPELCGLAGLYRTRHLRRQHVVELWGMYVQAAQRGRGVGKLLIEAAIQSARSWEGAAVLQLCVTDGAAAAQRVYERAGFRSWGKEPRGMRHAGRELAFVHMALDLD